MLLTCLATFIINRSDQALWLDKRDLQAYEQASVTCAARYGPRSPCLTRFYKIEPGVYHAICGAKKETPAIKEKD